MIKKNKGTILLITFLILGILFLLGSYFLTFTLSESKISKSQEAGIKTYYLAEAGINEAIWKLKNDADWSSQFISNPGWSANFSRSFAGGSYIISVQNSDLAQGEIISTAMIDLGGGRTSQRIVKVLVFKALGSVTNNCGLFTAGPSGDMNVNSSNITINDGNLFCGNVFNISSSSLTVNDNGGTGELEGQVLVNNNLIQSSTTITSETVCAKNECASECEICPAPSADLPSIDFNSSDPNSFKSRAQLAEDLNQCQILCNGSPCSTKCVFTSGQFSTLLSSVPSGGTMTINSEITYVMGSINISSKNLVVNGILVAENDINASSSSITVNRPDVQSPSGLISGKKINFSSMTMDITGVVYSSDQMNVSSSSGNITGAILGRKFNFSSLSSLNITLDNDIILYGLGYMIDGELVTPNPAFSPIITIDHWEESY